MKKMRMSSSDRKVKTESEKRNLSDLAWSAIGGAIAIGLGLWLVDGDDSVFLLASLGGSTVFLFALTGSEAAQPRALLGGHLGGAIIGILCFQILGDALWVSVIAVVLTMLFMMLTRTNHPPAGANPLFMVHYHAGFSALLRPVGLGVLALFLVAIVWSRIRPGKRYPIRWTEQHWTNWKVILGDRAGEVNRLLDDHGKNANHILKYRLTHTLLPTTFRIHS